MSATRYTDASPHHYWVLAQKKSDSKSANWELVTLETLDNLEAELVSAGYNVVGQVLDVSGFRDDERRGLGHLLNLRAWERDELGYAEVEADALARTPRCHSPGMDLDHGIARYEVRMDGEVLGAREVTSDEASEIAREYAQSLISEEARRGVTLRAAWSSGPDSGGVHLDYGVTEPDAATPVLLWAMKARVEDVCKAAEVPTTDAKEPPALRALAYELKAEGFPLRERRSGRVAAGDRADPIARYYRESLLVVEVTQPCDVEALLDRVCGVVPSVWVDTKPLNKGPLRRGGVYRPLGGLNKRGDSTKTAWDPSVQPSKITREMLEGYLDAAEGRLLDDREDSKQRKVTESQGPAGPRATRAVPTQKRDKRGAVLAALSDKLRIQAEGWAADYGKTFAECGQRRDAILGISGVMARRGICARVVGDLVYALAAAGGMNSEAATRARDAERGARGVLQANRRGAGWHMVRTVLKEDAERHLRDLVDALAPDTKGSTAQLLAAQRVLEPVTEDVRLRLHGAAFTDDAIDALVSLKALDRAAYENLLAEWAAAGFKRKTALEKEVNRVAGKRRGEGIAAIRDSVIRHAVRDGKGDGWFLSVGGRWNCEPRNEIKEYLQDNGLPRALLSSALEAPWRVVNAPFQASELPGRRWNISGARFSVEPAPGECPHWDLVFEHAGSGLDEAVANDPWCIEHGLKTGADYLRAWSASMFQRPLVPLPYLYMWGGQDAGKSMLYEMLALPLEAGFARGDRALTSGQGFNAELAGSVLVAIDELAVKLHTGRGSAYNRLKDWVTSKLLQIHGKGSTPFLLENSCHWIQCANDAGNCPILPGDTRITAFKVDRPTEVIPKEGSDGLLARLRRESPAAVHHLLSLSLPEPHGRLGIPPVDTEEKARLQRAQVSTLTLWLEETPQSVFFTDKELVLRVQNFAESVGDERRYWSRRKVLSELPERHEELRSVGRALRGFMFGGARRDFVAGDLEEGLGWSPAKIGKALSEIAETKMLKRLGRGWSLNAKALREVLGARDEEAA